MRERLVRFSTLVCHEQYSKLRALHHASPLRNDCGKAEGTVPGVTLCMPCCPVVPHRSFCTCLPGLWVSFCTLLTISCKLMMKADERRHKQLQEKSPETLKAYCDCMDFNTCAL